MYHSLFHSIMSSGGSTSHMTCGLKVDTRCKGWDKTMSKILGKVKGASYDLDAEEGMIYISGRVDPQKILRMIAKCGKHAELCWMRTGDQNLYNNGEISNIPPPPPPMPGPYSYNHLPFHGHGGYYPYYQPIPLPGVPPPLPPHYLPHPPYYD